MALIYQTTEQVGTDLSGITTGLSSGQTVFAIGWDKVFIASNSTQLYGTLIRVDEDTGAPLEVLKTNHNICLNIPYNLSWNQGNSMVSTTVDGVQYLYIRFRPFNPNNVYRGVWDESIQQFKDFEVFSTMSYSMSGNYYSNAARLTDDIIRIITQQPAIYEFDVRTGQEIRSHAIPGTSSTSSYPFANSFSPLADPSMIIGASGNGSNWYVHSAFLQSVSFNPSTDNFYTAGFSAVGTVQYIHPSTHHNVSYYTANNGIIKAYKNEGVYIQKNEEAKKTGAFIKKDGKWIHLFE